MPAGNSRAFGRNATESPMLVYRFILFGTYADNVTRRTFFNPYPYPSPY